MKNLTASLLIAGAMMAASLSAQANDSVIPVQHNLVTEVSASISQQAEQMFYATKAEILASVQQQLNSFNIDSAVPAITDAMLATAPQADADVTAVTAQNQ